MCEQRGPTSTAKATPLTLAADEVKKIKKRIRHITKRHHVKSATNDKGDGYAK